MNRGIIYYLVASKRNAVAIVSLWALRKFFTGNVHVLTSAEHDWDIVSRRIVEDERLGLSISHVPVVPVRRHAVNVTKTWLHRYSPFEETIFLDADTIPIKHFGELWPLANEMVLTQFANWVSTGSKIKSRVNWWAGLRPALVSKSLANNDEAVNTGVFAFAKATKMLEPWHQITLAGAKTFIPDEIAAQLIYKDYHHRLLDDRFNCSPHYGVNVGDVRIWHCHGGKHLRPRTEKLWRGLFKECWDNNVGFIKEWISDEDRRLYV